MQSEIYVGRASQGFVVRVLGRGTMNESPAFRKLVEANLPCHTVIFDASQCEYLDSTFLGCLIGLQKLSEQSPHDFLIAATPEKQMKLFSLSSLNRYFDFIPPKLEMLDELTHVDVDKLDARELGRHVMRCHSVLAERGGSEAPAFRAIAERLAQELGPEEASGDEREENRN